MHDLVKAGGFCLRFLAAVVALAAVAPALAQDLHSEWFETEQGRVRLVAAPPEAGKADLLLGLEFQLVEGWKIYWRAPGDTGYPPYVDWRQSVNLDAAELLFPAPERFTIFGIDSVGYQGGVVLPIAARRADPAFGVELSAAVDYLTCSDLCIPYPATLALSLPAAGVAGETAAMLQAAVANLPDDGMRAGLALVRSEVTTGNRPALLVEVRADAPLVHPDLFVEGPERVVFGRPQTTFADGSRRAVLRLPIQPGDAAPALIGQTVTLAFVDGARAFERPAALAAGASTLDAAGLAAMLGIALVGGLILNVMPCVLPVLSLKLLGVVHARGRSRRAVRWSFIATSAGILVTFLGLAAVLAGLRAAGVSVGWGVQFQQPVFLIAMAALLTAFGGNLLGLFDISLPGWAADLGARAPSEGLAGNVLTGATATLLAMPCSAPFLGTAVGFALAAGPLEILAVFAALGLGLALPYLVVAAAPGLARLLPRPGPWMIVVRRLLGLLILGTALWLITVLAAQVGAVAAAAVAAALALLLVVVALPGLGGVRWAGAVLALAVALAVPAVATPPARATAEASSWVPFDRGEIASYVRDGQVVLVDVTAEWCLTCKVNKRLVLDTGAVRGLIDAGAVVGMRADWTRPDEAIAAYLRSFGRYGIPFNAVYGPGAPEGLPLSELLTSQEVEAAIVRARGAGKGPRAIAATPPGDFSRPTD